MKMNVLRKSFYLLLAGVLTCGFTACSSDDDDNEPEVKVELSLLDTKQVTTFVSKGSFELPIQLTGITGMPKAADFTLLSMSHRGGNVKFKWDITESDGLSTPEEEPKLTVTGVSKGDGQDEYILTVDYDATVTMTSKGDIQLYYDGNNKAAETFAFSCQAYAQHTAALPVQTYKKSDVPVSLSINVQKAYEQLNVSPKDVHMVEGRHAIYAGIYGDEMLDIEKNADGWNKYDNVFLGVGYSDASDLNTPVITILGADHLETGITHFVQLILSLGHGEYAAIHVPILYTE